MEYSSNAKGNLGVTLGAIGTGLSILGSHGGIMDGMFAGGNQYVNKETFDVQLKLIDSQKDNAILTANLESEKKMVEVFNAANEKINNVRDEMNCRIYELDKKIDANAAAQAVINTNFTASTAVLQSQVAQLMGLTKTGIPNSSLCPGYGNVIVTPDTNGTTIA